MTSRVVPCDSVTSPTMQAAGNPRALRAASTQGLRFLGRYADEQSAGRLGVIKDVDPDRIGLPLNPQTGGDIGGVGGAGPCEERLAHELLSTPGISGDSAQLEDESAVASLSHLVGMARQTEAGHVRRAVSAHLQHGIAAAVVFSFDHASDRRSKNIRGSRRPPCEPWSQTRCRAAS